MNNVTSLVAVLAVAFGTVHGDKSTLYGNETVSVSLEPAKVEGQIDEKIYGHFLEHIFHSVNGGLWGEMIWNRSFEEYPGGNGVWSVEGNVIVQSSPALDVRLLFGEPMWRDYEYTLEAQKTGGFEGFLIFFRAATDKNFYRYNLGGWANRWHRMQKSVKGAVLRSVGLAVKSNIKIGRWYRIRVRCEGARIQMWLDDKQIFDFTDEQQAHLAGAVGLGTWNTAVQYRNIKVKSLDGKTLFQGLPPLAPLPTVAKYWNSYGQGQFQIVRDNPLNSEFAQVIVSQGDEAGVGQMPFCIRKGETYHGSLWARGEAQGGLVVRLLNGETELGKVALPAPGSQWHEYGFRFSPGRAAHNAALQVGVRGEGKVWLDQVSLMSEAAQETGGFRPDLLNAVAALQPPIIRWPGGCFAEWYRWKDGVGPQHKRIKYPISAWNDQDVSSFGTDEFIKLCRRVGSEPLIVINIGRHDLAGKRAEYIQEACEWIEYCNGPTTSKWGKLRAANGHPRPYNVKYWEIDNETWSMGPQSYCQAVHEFVPPMKKVDPSIRIAVCGSANFKLDWNREVIRMVGDIIDYLSIHHYEHPDKFAEGPRDYERFIRETGKLIAASANPNIKIYCSEWNAQSTDWRTGLYAGGLLNGFERCSDIFEIGGPALFLRHVSARDWDNAFINFDHRTWFPAPNYVVMKLWRQYYAPNRIAMTGKTEPLNAIATKSKDGKKIYFKVVNPSDKSVDVELQVKKGFKPKKVAMQLIAPDSLQARNTLDNRDTVRPVSGKVEQNGQTIKFTLPRFSAGVVIIGGDKQ